MKLTIYDPEKHDVFFPRQLFVEGMVGLALLRNDDTPAAIGGTAPFEWGQELWIYSRPNLSRSEKRQAARFARGYVDVRLEVERKLYAHARLGNEKWLKFLGFELEWIKTDKDGQEVRRWIRERQLWD